MAITKLMHIGEQTTEQSSKHLKSALVYIANAIKTKAGVLVGSVNCPLESAYEQMMETKRLFGKEGRRMAYHFVISFVPGEVSPEIAFEIVKQFVERYLGGQYEVVYSVHNDKDHVHCHIIFNSVRMTDGYKYSYKKGDWKKIIQPITNELCEKYNLDIMPAEYAVEPVNLSRKDWEHEQTFKPLIKEDVKFCVYRASSLSHFIYLMEQLGYEVKNASKEAQGKHIAVKTPDMKRFKRLDTISPEFTKERLEHEILYGNNYAEPLILTENPVYVKRNGHFGMQKQMYLKLLDLRVTEKYRFKVHAATKYEDLKRFRQLQNEYLFLCRENIHDIGELMDFVAKSQNEINEISMQQKDIYTRIRKEKDASRTDEDVIIFNSDVMGYHDTLDSLKFDKRELKKNIRHAMNCFNEHLSDYLNSNPQIMELENEDVGISKLLDLDVPEDPDTVKRQEHENQISVEEKHIADDKFYRNFLEQSQKKTDAFRKKAEEFQAIYDSLVLEDNSVTDEGDYLSDRLQEEDNLDNAINQNFAEINSLESVVEETVAIAIDENFTDAKEVIEEIDLVDELMEFKIPEKSYAENRPSSKEEYLILSVDERAKRLQMDMSDKFHFYTEFNNYLNKIGIHYPFSEMMEKADEISNAAKRISDNDFTEDRVEQILDKFVDISGRELFSSMAIEEKAELFNIDITDSRREIRVYGELLKRLGINKSQSEQFDEFQKIMDVAVKKERENRFGWKQDREDVKRI